MGLQIVTSTLPMYGRLVCALQEEDPCRSMANNAWRGDPDLFPGFHEHLHRLSEESGTHPTLNSWIQWPREDNLARYHNSFIDVDEEGPASLRSKAPSSLQIPRGFAESILTRLDMSCAGTDDGFDPKWVWGCTVIP